MKLYVTLTSPYARIARVIVLEKALADKVEIIEAATRKADSPYYGVNPSGRVPYLEVDDAPGMEDSRLIAAYLDSLDGKPSFILPYDAENWAHGRLEASARSMLDGISVWVREMRRPGGERSPGILAHEASRAERLADTWENQIDSPSMNGPLNFTQMALIAAVDVAAYHRMADYTEARPRLRRWAERLRQIPSIAATAPTVAAVGSR